MQPPIEIETLGNLSARCPEGTALLAVDIPEQRLFVRIPDRFDATYPISSGKTGVGFTDGSGATPLGWHRVSAVIGNDASPGQVFQSRKPVDLILPPDQWAQEVGEDLILSRILRLQGLEERNRNTESRYIYLHGTNAEGKLGQAVSAGCIRLANADIIELCGHLPEGLQVRCWIGAIHETAH